MENILSILYNNSIKFKTIDQKDIEKIIEIIIYEKHLEAYILNMNIQSTRSNVLASYSNYTKAITIYINLINKMIYDIKKSNEMVNECEKHLYYNLLILQVLLHEVEHANQQKIAYSENSLEALILRLSYLVDDGYSEKLYEYCPEERFAEIKSVGEILYLIETFCEKYNKLHEAFILEKNIRQLRGYHYKNSKINTPLIDYFTLGKREKILSDVEYLIKSNNLLLDERFKYGFPISKVEYSLKLKNILLK